MTRSRMGNGEARRAAAGGARLAFGLPLAAAVLLAGCGSFLAPLPPPGGEIAERLRSNRALIERGQYEAARQENEALLARDPAAADVALFNLGLLHSHAPNPRRDYARARAYFQRLVKEHPESPLAEPSAAWLQLLEEHQRLVQEGRLLAEEKRTLAREKEALAQEREKLTTILERSRQVDLEVERLKRKRQGR